MAVNVNNVYQTVLALANKEQRGYITPQEFNLFANQAQLEIFDNYFYELDRALRSQANDTVYADKVDSLREKIEVHEAFNETVTMNGNVGTLPSNTYKLGKVSTSVGIEIQLVPQNELNHYLNNNLLKPTESHPLFVRTGQNSIKIYPSTIIDNVVCNVVKKPTAVEWAYVIINDKALYNANLSVDFDLHDSEERHLVTRILEMAGITIKDESLSASAFRERANNNAIKTS